MDLIVCGDALWISCGTWIAFWNGVVGASVAAAAGAVVALVVVRLTNAQQRHGVERTIEVAAIADFVAAAGELDWAVRYRMKEPREFDPGPHILGMRAAVARLHMSQPKSREIVNILLGWPETLHQLITLYQLFRLRELSNADEILDVLSKANTRITLALPLAVRRVEASRIVGIRALKTLGSELDEAVEHYQNELLEHFPGAPVPPKRPEASVDE